MLKASEYKANKNKRFAQHSEGESLGESMSIQLFISTFSNFSILNPIWMNKILLKS